MPRKPGEFELIERYFAPLTKRSKGSFGLHNDAAVLDVQPGQRLVVSVDCMVAGRHFLPGDPPDTVACKLLRVSLSDLAAMGAVPRAYLLSASWPEDIDESWIAAFSKGLEADQRRFGVTLAGGDTTATGGPMCLSLTAFGEVGAGPVLDRGSLREGDDLYLSGSLGDAYLGLRALRGELDDLPESLREELIGRYRCPQPRVSLGPALLVEGLAASALDVSDGLAQDLGHLLAASGVGATVWLAEIPVSAAARAALEILGEPLQVLLSGGDDYELLFAAPPENRERLQQLSSGLSLAITRIGQVSAAKGLTILDTAGRPVAIDIPGWTHF